jgi:hypothetical protein
VKELERRLDAKDSQVGEGLKGKELERRQNAKDNQVGEEAQKRKEQERNRTPKNQTDRRGRSWNGDLDVKDNQVGEAQKERRAGTGPDSKTVLQNRTYFFTVPVQVPTLKSYGSGCEF